MSDLTKIILEKISSYNIFNNFVPSVVFSVLFKNISGINIISGNLICDLIIMYALGMIISRSGSLIIEPVFLKTRIIKRTDYNDYLVVENVDPKLNIFLQEMNMYRTMATIFLFLLLVKGIMIIIRSHPNLKSPFVYFLLVFGFVIFSISYKKQNQYMFKRITAAKKKIN